MRNQGFFYFLRMDKMFFAIGFLLLFTFDILLFFGFRFFGMIPLYFVKSAVEYFTAFLLYREKKRSLIEWDYPLIFSWSLYLIVVSTFELIIECLLYFDWIPRKWDQEKTQILSSIGKAQIVQLFLTGILFIITIYHVFKQYKKSYQWLLFTLVAILSRNILLIFWNPMPVFFYRYFGILELPGMFGLLMVIVTVLKNKYTLSE